MHGSFLSSTSLPSYAVAPVQGYNAARGLQPDTGYSTNSRSSSEALIPLYATTTTKSQEEALPVSAFTSSAHRDALLSRYYEYNRLGIERETLPPLTATDLLHQSSFDYGTLQQRSRVNKRKGQLHRSLTEFSDRVSQAQASGNFDELVRQDIINQTLNAERQQIHGSFMGICAADPMSSLSMERSILPGQLPLASSRMQLGNDLSIASSLSSPSVLHQERLSLQRMGGGETDHVIQQSFLPNLSISSSLLPPMTAAAGRISQRGARGLSTTNTAPSTVSISRDLLKSNQLASGEQFVALTAGSAGSIGNRVQGDAFRRSSSTDFGGTTRPVPPPCIEGDLQPYSERTVLSLATNEDSVLVFRSDSLHSLRSG